MMPMTERNTIDAAPMTPAPDTRVVECRIERLLDGNKVTVEIDVKFSDGHTLLSAIGSDHMQRIKSQRGFAVAVIVALFAGATPDERNAMLSDTPYPAESKILAELSK